MSSYNYVFFDLDGTISDSAPGIISSLQYALNEVGVETPEEQELMKLVGPPLMESLTGYFGMSRQTADKALSHFRKYYEEKGILENTMYEGIAELIRTLKAAGRAVVLATSKPEPFAREIISRYGIDAEFDFIAGSCMDETRTKKAEVIAYALEAIGLSDPSKAVMVGDRSYDVIGAAENGMSCIGVLYGYGSCEELESAGAKYIAATAAEVAQIVLNLSAT